MFERCFLNQGHLAQAAAAFAAGSAGGRPRGFLADAGAGGGLPSVVVMVAVGTTAHGQFVPSMKLHISCIDAESCKSSGALFVVPFFPPASAM